MRNDTHEANDAHEAASQALFAAVAARDRGTVSNMLAESPLLATLAMTLGATRVDASAYYFEAVAHYAYAGDTALHIAAAATYAFDELGWPFLWVGNARSYVASARVKHVKARC